MARKNDNNTLFRHQTKHRKVGNAGLIAGIGMAIAGVLVGALSSYVGSFGVVARATLEAKQEQNIAPAPVLGPRLQFDAERFDIDIETFRQLSDNRAAAQTALAKPVFPEQSQHSRPKIYIVIDDLGLDPVATEKTLNLPGPLTYSFLPYGRDVQRFVDTANAIGGDVLLHLPMEPRGDADPGPRALKTSMAGADYLAALEWNLAQFDGYVGVNNHMGSRLTADEAAMKTLLSVLNERDLFFLDSLTTGSSKVKGAGARVGATVVTRDIFLDDLDNRDSIRLQLLKAEKIARETGYAIAIGHPRQNTLDVLGPWLATAPARGFDLVQISDLIGPSREEAIAMVTPPAQLRQ